MEVKIEPSDQFIEKNYSEMCEKYGKLQQDYAVLQQEMAEVRNENSKLKKEMAKNNEKYKKQIAILHKELTKLMGRDQGELESRQSQNYMMDPSQNNTFDHLPRAEEIAQNGEFAAKTMIMDFQMGQQQQPSQNLDNTSPENTNTIIKQELENDEMGTNSPLFQMPTTSSTTLNVNNEEKEDECDEQQDQDGLEKFVVEIEGLGKIEWDDEEESCSPSIVEMDLDDGEGEGQISLKDKIMQLLQSGKEGDNIDGQIKCAPTKIGNILKCNWPGCEYQMKTIGDMLIHWREHTEPRPPSYVCVECGKSFKRSNNLKKHELTHKKPYQCDVCGQSFKHSYSLNEHKRNHTGEKPYLCMVGCGESFKTSNELWKHSQKPCTTLGNYSNIWHSGDGKME